MGIEKGDKLIEHLAAVAEGYFSKQPKFRERIKHNAPGFYAFDVIEKNLGSFAQFKFRWMKKSIFLLIVE